MIGVPIQMIGKPNWRLEMIGDKCCAQRNNMTVSTRHPDSGPKNVLCHFSAQNQVLLHLKKARHVTVSPTLLNPHCHCHVIMSSPLLSRYHRWCTKRALIKDLEKLRKRTGEVRKEAEFASFLPRFHCIHSNATKYCIHSNIYESTGSFVNNHCLEGETQSFKLIESNGWYDYKAVNYHLVCTEDRLNRWTAFERFWTALNIKIHRR